MYVTVIYIVKWLIKTSLLDANIYFNVNIRQYKKTNSSHDCIRAQAYSGTLSRCEIVRVNASLGELRRDKEKLSSPISCELKQVKVS